MSPRGSAVIGEPPAREGLNALVDRIATIRPELTIWDGPRSVEIADLAGHAQKLAGGLDAQGIRAGDHVAIWMRNRLEWLEVWFALTSLGAVLVPLNTRFSLAEVDYVLRHGQVSWLIWRPGDGAAIGAESLAGLEAAGVALRGRVIVDGQSSAEHELEYAFVAQSPALTTSAERPDTPGMIQYTSGSTAFPKGAMLRNDGLVRNAYGLGRAWQLTPEDRVLCSNPLFHCGGSVFAFLAGFTHGCSIALMDTWRIDDATQLIDRLDITALPLIDAALRDVVAHAHATGHRFESVRVVSTAADRGIFERAHQLIGCEVSNVYGLTESSPNVCVGDLSDPLEMRLAHIGRAQPGLEVTLADPETGAHPIDAETGEILVRGWSVMEGYFNDEEATARTLLPDGFLRTGDLGRIDVDGYLDYMGRAKLMIKSGGENIAIEEIESALRLHPDVADAIVVPVPHERFGEVGHGYLRPHPGASLDPDDVLAAARQRVAGFKLPKTAEIVDDLPRTGSGKVDRVSLTLAAREQVADRTSS